MGVQPNSRTKKLSREPVDPGTHQIFDLLTEGRGHRRGGDSIIRVPLLAETKVDTGVVPGMHTNKEGEVNLGTAENGLGTITIVSDVEETTPTGIVPWISVRKSVFWDVIFIMP